MSQPATTTTTMTPFRTLPKDIGVTLIVVIALALGLLLRLQAEGSKDFSSTNPNVHISYPATWRTVTGEDGALLHVEDPLTASAYKTNVTVESRELDPASPPTLQELVDRRVVQHGNLLGYHLLSNAETNIGGSRASQLDYAYVVQPIDTPRSASTPVVVRSREYIVITKDHIYYVTLSAPESDFSTAGDRFNSMISTAQFQ